MPSDKDNSVSNRLDDILLGLDVVKRDVSEVKGNVSKLEKDVDNVYALVEAVQKKVLKQADVYVKKEDLAKVVAS